MQTVLVVGAGPAGLMAALSAAQCGVRVVVCEKQVRAGVKLLASGGGRCNLTNTASIESITTAFGRRGRFAEPALTAMSPTTLRDFFKRCGVPTFSPDGFHVYPVAQSSQRVLDALLSACRKHKVALRLKTCIRELALEKGALRGAWTAEREWMAADAVVLATGGATYPNLGGSEAGYTLARQAGHEVTPLYPVLVDLVTAESWPTTCAGASLSNVEVAIESPRFPCSCIRGDVLFTHRGISGPAILDLSRDVVPLLAQHRVVAVRLQLTAEPAEGWEALFASWRQHHGRKRVASLLDSVLPASVSRAVVMECGLALERTAAQLTGEERHRLTRFLTGAKLSIVGTGGRDRAMVTRGGVALKQVDPRTLQSRLVAGLYFAGEILDLDGPCGGYNLQWAFSSGWLAGRNAAAHAMRM